MSATNSPQGIRSVLDLRTSIGPAAQEGLCKPPQRPDCVAGHVGLELRNVIANYPFESSRGFPDPSRISAMETTRV
jgi:hypothetical protein